MESTLWSMYIKWLKPQASFFEVCGTFCPCKHVSMGLMVNGYTHNPIQNYTNSYMLYYKQVTRFSIIIIITSLLQLYLRKVQAYYNFHDIQKIIPIKLAPID